MDMWERFDLFAPSFLIIALLGLMVILGVLFLKWKVDFDNQTIAWHFRNSFWLLLFTSFPAIMLKAPLTEELFFRGPLLLVCEEVNFLSVLAILTSAFLFCLVHWKVSPSPNIGELFQEKSHYTLAQAREEGLVNMANSESVIKRTFRLTSSFTVGVICGLLAVYFQSMWAAVIFHFLWNFLVITLMIPLMLVGGALWVLSGGRPPLQNRAQTDDQ